MPASSNASPLPQRKPTRDSAAPGKEFSILKMLKKQVVIGSTIDPKLHQLNPYGLTIAPATAGDFQAGDLVVCNFNAKSNVQGTGYTIVALHPTPGSSPTLVSDTKALRGCDALALDPNDDIWAADFSANDNPVLSPAGTLDVNIKGKPFDRPWGQVYAQPATGSAAFYESNAGNGTVVRINLGTTFTYDVIAKGFAVKPWQAGRHFWAVGLTYDPSVDTLYIVDGTNDTVVAFKNVSTIPAGGIAVAKTAPPSPVLRPATRERCSAESRSTVRSARRCSPTGTWSLEIRRSERSKYHGRALAERQSDGRPRT